MTRKFIVHTTCGRDDDLGEKRFLRREHFVTLARQDNQGITCFEAMLIPCHLDHAASFENRVDLHGQADDDAGSGRHGR